MTTFGYMLEMARGATSWLDPQLLGLRPEVDGLLPYWLGAWAMQWGPAWMSPVLLVRLPFALMLSLTLIATWYAVYYLARSPRAQPVAFAFGGEANPTDYARAIADGGLLALIACLGLAQLSHEITTHLAQLCFATLVFYAAAAIGYRIVVPTVALAVGLVGLVLSAAPTLAVLFGAGAALLHLLAADPATGGRRGALRAAGDAGLLTLLAAALASALDLWRWRILLPQDAGSKDWRSLARLLLWFTWPAWPLVLWTLWRWRRQITSPRISLHLALPLWFAAITVFSALTTKPADRALLLSLPALADSGGICIADAAPQRVGPDRLVHAAVLHRLRHRDLGDLVCHADRRSEAGRGQRVQAGAQLPRRVLAADISDRAARVAGLGMAGQMARRPPPGGHLEKPGAARRRRRVVLAAADDAVDAAARLRAQLPAGGRKPRRAGRAGAVPAGTGPRARPDRGVPVPRRLHRWNRNRPDPIAAG